jgi:hypothetical protein
MKNTTRSGGRNVNLIAKGLFVLGGILFIAGRPGAWFPYPLPGSSYSDWFHFPVSQPRSDEEAGIYPAADGLVTIRDTILARYPPDCDLFFHLF